MSVYGCPDQKLNNWQHSQNHAVHRSKYAWGVNGIDSLALKDNVINLGPIGLNSSTFQLNYCVKQSTSDDQRMKDAEWPRGLYAIFSANYECPIGKFMSSIALNFVCLIDSLCLINKFSVNRDGSSWVEPVLS